MDWKRISKRLLYPPIWLIILLTVFSAAALVAVFVKSCDTSPVAYAVYVLSFYTLVVLTLLGMRLFSKWYRIIREMMYKNKYINRYLTDAAYKTRVMLNVSVIINLLYAAMNLVSGIIYRSGWFWTLAVYYILLSIMRLTLLRHAMKNPLGKQRETELRKYRLCGVILMLMNMTLAVVVILVIKNNRSFEYAGILIYVMAAYTFYILTASIVNMIKYRKYNSPVMSSSKVISLVAALVSLLSLETAMLHQFDDGTVTPFFRQIMVALTGVGVCAFVLSVSIYMISHSTKELKCVGNNHNEGEE